MSTPSAAALARDERLSGIEAAAYPRCVTRAWAPPRGVHWHTQIGKKMVRLPRKELSIREERFALAYLVNGNAALAARRAGISADQSHREGYRLLNRRRVADFIEAERVASIARTRIDVDCVKREYARIAFCDIADIVRVARRTLSGNPGVAEDVSKRFAEAVALLNAPQCAVIRHLTLATLLLCGRFKRCDRTAVLAPKPPGFGRVRSSSAAVATRAAPRSGYSPPLSDVIT
jgi:hypothetical protein